MKSAYTQLKTTHSLLLLLGLGRVVGGRGSLNSLDRLAVGLGLGELARDGLAPATARLPLDLPLLLPLFLVCRLCNLADHLAAVELGSVEELDSLLRGLGGVQGYKPVACGTGASQDHLGSEATRVGREPY